MIKFIKMFILILLVSGCAQLDSITNRSVDKVSDLIIGYCTTTDKYVRMQFRQKINKELMQRGFYATAEINCGND